MRFGKYEISDWILGTPLNKEYRVWYKLVIDTDKVKDNHYKITVYDSELYKGWKISIAEDTLALIYEHIFGEDPFVYAESLTFPNDEESKAHIDMFLNKLIKLKMFL